MSAIDPHRPRRPDTLRRLHRDHRGQVLLESVLVAPILLMLMVAVVDQGWMHEATAKQVAAFRSDIGKIVSRARKSDDPDRHRRRPFLSGLRERRTTVGLETLGRGMPLADLFPTQRWQLELDDNLLDAPCRKLGLPSVCKPKEDFEFRRLSREKSVERVFDPRGRLRLSTEVMLDEGPGTTGPPGYGDFMLALGYWRLLSLTRVDQGLERLATISWPGL